MASESNRPATDDRATGSDIFAGVPEAHFAVTQIAAGDDDTLMEGCRQLGATIWPTNDASTRYVVAVERGAHDPVVIGAVRATTNDPSLPFSRLFLPAVPVGRGAQFSRIILSHPDAAVRHRARIELICAGLRGLHRDGVQEALIIAPPWFGALLESAGVGVRTVTSPATTGRSRQATVLGLRLDDDAEHHHTIAFWDEQWHAVGR